MIYREIINKHVYVNNTHHIVNCDKCQRDIAVAEKVHNVAKAREDGER